MDKIDIYENYQTNENNSFNEYQEFKAEDYSVKEYKLLKKENIEFSENYSIGAKTNTNNHQESDNFKKANELKNNTLKNVNKLASTTSNIIMTTGVVLAGTIIGVVPGVELFSQTDLKMTVIEESLTDLSTPNEILIEGEIENLKSEFPYFVTMEQYYNQELLSYNEMIELEINESNETFIFSVPACYGLTSYQYEIYYSDEDEMIELYSSEEMLFGENQAYNARYDKISPNEAELIYNDDETYNLILNTNFETDFPAVYAYKLNVLTKEGIVCAQYEGTDQTVNLNLSYQGVIYFEYIDIGYFSSGTHEYNQTKLDESIDIDIPKVLLLNDISIRGDYFVIPYQVQTIYDLSLMSLTLEFSNESGIITKNIDNLTSEGKIVLDNFDGEIGEIKIRGKLNFAGNESNTQMYSINIAETKYDLNYKFNITEVRANVFDSMSENIPIFMKMEYLLPESYQINILNSELSIDEKYSLSNEITITSFPNDSSKSITISILNSNNEIWSVPKTINLHTRSELLDLYDEPDSYLSVNPYESVVTYNDDGTINIYRDINFSTTDERNYYDAALYFNEIIDSVELTKEIHQITNNRYAIFENIPNEFYFFRYYKIMKYDGVFYYLSEEMPSGGIANNVTFTTEAQYDALTDKTTITIVSSNYGIFDNYCLINDVKYEYDTSEEIIGGATNTKKVIVAGNQIGKTVKFYFTQYSNNYDNYVEKMDIIGNKFKNYEIIIEEMIYE